MYKFIIYSRRSKVRKIGNQLTHETAEWQVKNYLKTLDERGIPYEIVDHIAEDISGYGYYTKRPLFTNIVRRCKEDRSITLLSSKCDRVARDSWTGSELLKTINMVIASDPEADDLTLQMMFAISEKEVKNTSDRYKATYKAKKADCLEKEVKFEWGANSSKYQENKAAGNHKVAYTRNREATKQKLIPVVENIKKIIDFSNNSLTLDEISEKLNTNGFTTTRGGKWSKGSVSRVIKEFGIQREKLNKHVTCNV